MECGNATRRRPENPALWHLRWNILAGLSLLVGFGALICIVAQPWRALQLGRDEGYELMKAFLVSQGHPLYSQVWNDQPPLHTELVALLFRVLGPSAGAARVLTVMFAVLYLWALYHLAARLSGRAAGLMAAAFAGMAPIFLRLGVSVMLELPTMALALTSVWALSLYLATRRTRWALLSGGLFGCALQVKLTAAVFAPAIALEFLVNGGAGRQFVRSLPQLRTRWALAKSDPASRSVALESGEAEISKKAAPPRNAQEVRNLSTIGPPLLWCAAGALSFGVIVLLFYPPQTLKIFWQSHFSAGTVKSAMPAGYGFDARSLLGDSCPIAAVGGLIFILQERRWDLIFPVALLAALFGVHLLHRPYWYYYELHFIAPLAWLAAVGVVEWFRVLLRQAWPTSIPAKLRLMLGIMAWSTMISSLAATAPMQMWDTFAELDSAPLATQDERVQALTRNAATTHWVFTDQLICAFWARLPVSPELAVIPLKRIWSGQIGHDEIISCLERYRPEQILLQPDWEERFRLSGYISKHYHAGDCAGLFVRNSIAEK